MTAIQFQLPNHLANPLPTEARGLARDQVRLLVSDPSTDEVTHHIFTELDQLLRPGDALVVNTSGTLPAALSITLPDGQPGRLHLGTLLPNGKQLVELRRIKNDCTSRWKAGRAGQQIKLPGGALLILTQRFYQDVGQLDLWESTLQLPLPYENYLHRYGEPIRYQQLHKRYPLTYYQTVFAEQYGSAEMPSAGRAFTTDLCVRLIRKGVHLIPICLHTGISSLEVGERPYPEWFSISESSALEINAVKAAGGRVIAVGTTALRALESATQTQQRVVATTGFTELYVQADTSLQITDGLLTGWHEPEASHLEMLAALASIDHLDLAYEAALAHEYHWHEFGDLHLIMT